MMDFAGLFFNYASHFSYFAIILLLLVSSIGIPFPEELILLGSGYLASIGIFTWWGAVIACFFGVMIGDNAGYYLGKHGSVLVRRLISNKKFAYVEEYFKKHGGKTIFFSRFLSAIRVFFPIAAGMTGMPWRRFLLYNTLASIIWVPPITLLGFWFGKNWQAVWAFLVEVDKAILAIVIIAVVVAIAAYNIKRHRIITETHANPLEIGPGEVFHDAVTFGNPKEHAKRIISKVRLADGRIMMHVEHFRKGKLDSIQHVTQWVSPRAYHRKLKHLARKVGRLSPLIKQKAVPDEKHY